MKTPITKIRRIVAAIAIPALLITAATASAQSQQNNQLALQLGAIQLGYTTSEMSTNTQFLANALTQGQKALLATTTNKYVAYVSTNGASTNAVNTNQPVAQSGDFRSELYQATLNALNSPILNTNKYTGINAIPVVTYNPKNGKFTTNKLTTFGLNPALTTPNAVLAITAARVPNFDAGLISNAVAATMAFTNNTNGVYFPIWGPQPSKAALNKAGTNSTNVNSLNITTAGKQLVNAEAAAATGLKATLKNYAAGTKQWAPVSAKTGPLTNGVYLPNYTTKAVGPVGGTQYQPNLIGLADAAAAVAANAINGLGDINTNSTGVGSIYGKSAPNVQAMAQKLVASVVPFQKTSTSALVQTHYTTGALGAAGLGLTTQVAGDQNFDWGNGASMDSYTVILNSLVKGSVKAVGLNASNLQALAAGVASGFTVAYLESSAKASNLTVNSYHTFSSNIAQIFQAFNSTGLKLNVSMQSAITAAITTGIQNVYSAAGLGTASTDPVQVTWNGTWNLSSHTIAGAPGINLGITNVPSLINGVGTPVTDTIGL